MKKFFTLGLILLLTRALLAQSITVSGTVTDAEDNSPMPGVNVVIKGTSQGTVTDIQGKYQIAANPNDVLVFSFVGYVSTDRQVGNQSVIDLALVPDVTSLKEIVVVGYGQQEKKDVTGVVDKVDTKNFNKGPIVSPDQLIAGKVAGVQITQNSGEPGGQTSIRIRGGTSIKASNEPLFVIDGVPIQNDVFNPGGLSGGRNPLNFINPNDIESFTVLKDASAAAIYGSRAANGVVIITTKKGNKNEKGTFSYDGYYSVSQPDMNFQILNAEEFRNVVTAKAANKLGQLGNDDTNWMDEIMRTAQGQNHSMSYSGGSERTGYRASIGYQDLQGIIKTSRTQRVSMDLNLNSSLLKDQLTYNINFKGSYTKDRFSPGVIGNAASFDPTQPVYNPGSDSTGGYFEFVNDPITVDNPVSMLNQTQEYGKTYRNIGNIDLEYKLPFVQGLSAKLNVGFDITNGQRERFMPRTLESQRSGDKGEVRTEDMLRQNTLLDAFLNYKRDFENIHSSINFVGGYSYQDFSGTYKGFRAWNLDTDIFGLYSARPATKSLPFISIEENRLISFFGRINYAFKDRYILTATVRRDGSTRFSDENKWGTFPSMALAWRVLEENFAHGLDNVFSDLKLRVGYGVNGNQEIGNYLYLPTYTYSDATARYQFGNTYVSTLRPNGYDSELKWEQTTSYNAGLDFGLFAGRLTGSMDYYYKETNDLLFDVAVPAGANLTNIITSNIGSVENQGFEVTLNGIVVDSKDFDWNLSANASYNKNTIKKLDQSNDPTFQGYPTGGISGGVGNNIQILKVGNPVNAFFTYQQLMDDQGNPRKDGVDYNEDGVVNLADMYADLNGDGMVDDNDKRPYRKPAPDVIIGVTSNMTYKNFDLSFTLRANIGNYNYNNNASNYGNFSRLTATTPNNIHASALSNGFTNPQYFSDIYIENASFCRVDNISLGYTFSQISDAAHIRLYATVQNAFVFTNYTGIDPETNNGIDNNLYPRSRTFLVGLNIGF